MNQSIREEGKTMAIISYITVIGLIIAYFVNRDKNNEFINFHIKQSFRIIILAVIITVIANILVMITRLQFLSNLNVIPFILMGIGAINANQLKVEKIPFIGDLG
ncbi:DUF4870 domain-containing protein [Cellulophaga baltica]|uniref:DUF4870 domain-containing protein n=1 Tax=Cellulophaga TaxID=104264 RepID=UPI001C076ECC|nr:MULTISPECIES: DUF4870 domain-containing protein [Cellulophaga]MBU2996150.1 DUF4870 domain-containing protein [Cellulophaga baltica]MDO6767545.1 DUF4870 domain-containing protein [Cellulophaga sp. 1_MG-2023]